MDDKPKTLELPRRDWGTLICLCLIVGFMVLVWLAKQCGILAS